MVALRSIVSVNVFLHVHPGVTGTSAVVDFGTDPAETAEATLRDGEARKHDGNGDGDGETASNAQLGLKVVFFVTGNPGLIGYYGPFLSLLARDLEARGRHGVVVAGMSLGGFEVAGTQDAQGGVKGLRARDGHGAADPDSHGSRDGEVVEEAELLRPSPFRHSGESEFTLQEQIELSYARLENLVGRLREHQEKASGWQEAGPVEVVLLGHSVGAYICLELVRLWHERHEMKRPPRNTERECPAASNARTTSPVASPPKEPSTISPPWKPSTCILLTPTIQDIHHSPSGLIATPLLTHISFLPSLAHTLLHSVLLRVLPTAWFAPLVSRVTGMKPGSHGLEATLAFLKSERGVRQALYMAGLEMKEIRKDRWGEEVWGASQREAAREDSEQNKTSNPKLFFWFAKEDHWVADITKQTILNNRASECAVEKDCVAGLIGRHDDARVEKNQIMGGGQREKTVIRSSDVRILETDGLVHAWCLDQSEFVARRVALWLDEVWAKKD